MDLSLKIDEILEINKALSSLNTYPKLQKRKDGTEEVTEVPYIFSGKFRWNLAKNITIVGNQVRDYNTVRDALIIQFTKEGQSGITYDANPEGWLAFQKEDRELHLKLLELKGLLKLDVNELLKPENPVPASIISKLSVLLEEPTFE